MKRLLMMLLLTLTVGLAANAQTEVKVKKTTTPVQKVHNLTHRRHKHYKGYKVKRKYSSGRVTKKKVDTKTGEVEIKNN